MSIFPLIVAYLQSFYQVSMVRGKKFQFGEIIDLQAKKQFHNLGAHTNFMNNFNGFINF